MKLIEISKMEYQLFYCNNKTQSHTSILDFLK